MKWIKLGVVVSLLVIIVNCGGKKPSIPEIIVPSIMIPNVADTFTAVSTDPNGNSVQYQFDWGNSVQSNWSGFLPSGSTYKTTYTYSTKGTYYVKARAQDNSNKTSDWCEAVKVVCDFAPLLWDLPADEDFDCEVNCTPAIDDQGNIYFGCAEGHIHCVNRINGSQRWRYTTAEEGEVVASPVIASDGTVYACDRDGYIYALNSNGSLKWIDTTGADIVATPAIGRKNEIYINTADSLLAINAQGQLMWSIESIYGFSSVTIDQSNNLYVGTDEGRLYSLDTAGTIRWWYPIGNSNEIISSPTITSTGKICFGGDNGYFYMLYPDGSELTVPQEVASSISASAVVGSDGSIYITDDDGYLHKFNSDGVEQWFFPTEGSACSSPAVVNDPSLGDIIYFKASWAKKNKGLRTGRQDEDSLYMIKSNSQELGAGWVVQLDASEGIISSPMVGSDGTIYIGGGIDGESDRGGLFALSGRGAAVNSVWPLFRRDKKNTGRAQ
jgi:outer membrane protein assembly factor BamB